MRLRTLINAAPRACLISRFRIHSEPRIDLVLTGLVIAAIAVTRWLAFPASIWDIDEAIFANALVDFNPAANYPHPPFFPLWIAVGTVLRVLVPGIAPATALQLASACFSVWMVFPLFAMWTQVLSPRRALVATLLFTLSPLAWILSGRAYTSTAATALLVAAVAIWLRRDLTLSGVAMGAVYLTASLLVRPQMLPVALALAAWRICTGRNWTSRLLPVALPLIVGLPVVLLMAGAAGGMDELKWIVGRHGHYHFGALTHFSTSWQNLSILQACGGMAPGAIWLLASVHGMVCLCMNRVHLRVVGPLVVLVNLPLVLLLTGAENPTALRYTIPYFAFTSGFVVASVGFVPHGRWLRRTILVSILVALVAATAPHLKIYRRQPSPAVQCMKTLSACHSDQKIHLIADRSLVSFLDLYTSITEFRPTLTPVYEIRGDRVVTDRANAVAVFDRGRSDWRLRGSQTLAWSCNDPWLRHFASPRFLDVVAVYGVDSVGGGSVFERITISTPGIPIDVD